MLLRPYYRNFELPWEADLDNEAFFAKLWRILLLACIALGILIWLIDVPERDTNLAPSVPPRLAKIVIEKEIPPPPPPPVVEPEPIKPTDQAKPREQSPRPKPDARERASKAGLLAFQDDLADLRQQFELTKEQMTPTANDTGAIDGPTRSERSLITSKVGQSSGGINTAGQSRGFGGGSGNLGGHATTQVVVPFGGGGGAGDGSGVRRSGASKKAARSREEVELIFDRNKGAIYALYSRALREKPELQGKMVLEFTIAPSGEVTMCRVVSSELNDADLERKIVSRVRLFRFEAKDVETVTTTKPIDFFPA
ncbi:MAG: AgmX/PglI C-terminal domain-containing protein [Steroidobacteraceae bacterium]